ncbi:helix-turn-helix transcriptional regulator [Geminicoccus flavidas]|uniref:helix-turn-helix transcriptional regulator n=1 Tax=Geminicoccus flavidas TaxID=2506407 RepID=UPI001F3F1E2A|nr:response regulator transcription factor [Geminicoccus flavidas]
MLATDTDEEVVWLGQARVDLVLVLVNLGHAEALDEDLLVKLETFTRSVGDVPVAVLADGCEHAAVMTALACGLRGFIPTTMLGSAAIEVIRLLCAGGTYVPTASLIKGNPKPAGLTAAAVRPLPLAQPPAALARPRIMPYERDGGLQGRDDEFDSQTLPEEDAPLARFQDHFTPRQLEILNCLRRGLANKMIAYELQMRESTVKIHVRNIMKKLHATNRTQVVSMTWNMFEPGQCAAGR